MCVLVFRNIYGSVKIALSKTSITLKPKHLYATMEKNSMYWALQKDRKDSI